jgi:hypothetical protein
MGARERVHDRLILDALEAIGSEPFEHDVWRVARKGRNPIRGGSANGRWSPASEFKVLYTSLVREGAVAEVGYRLSLEPIWPSRFEHQAHQLDLKLKRALHFADLSKLEPLGVDINRYESFEYTSTQAIASAAHFLAFDGLIVPSARYDCRNAVIFLDRLDGEGLEVMNTELVDWSAWRKQR